MSVDVNDRVELESVLSRIKGHIHSFDVGECSAEAAFKAIKDEVEA
jgi:hypothetical protein